MKFFSETVDHQERVVDAKSQTHTSNEVEGKDANAGRKRDEIDEAK